MDIPYVTRSKFLEPCQAALLRTQHAKAVDGGEEIFVALASGGYGGKFIVTVEDNGSSCFEVSWATKDWTRFPARIRAAATALKSCGRFGRFEIEHRNGQLVIRPRELF
jgi:hypothetical protein